MSAAPVRVRAGLGLLMALFVASLALRPQLVGVGPLLPEIEADLGVSHAVAGLLSTIPVMCMAAFAPAAAPLTAWASLRTAIAACVFGVAAFGLARAAAPGAGLVLALTVPVGVGIAVAGALLPIAVKARFADRPRSRPGCTRPGSASGRRWRRCSPSRWPTRSAGGAARWPRSRWSPSRSPSVGSR